MEGDIKRLKERTVVLSVEVGELAERNDRYYMARLSQLAEAMGYVYREPEEIEGCYVPLKSKALL